MTMEKSGCPSDARSGISGEYPQQGQCTVAQSQDTEEAEVSRCMVLSPCLINKRMPSHYQVHTNQSVKLSEITIEKSNKHKY